MAAYEWIIDIPQNKQIVDKYYFEQFKTMEIADKLGVTIKYINKDNSALHSNCERSPSSNKITHFL